MTSLRSKKIPPTVDELADAGVELLEVGKLRRAEKVFRRLLEADPGCVVAHFNLVRVYWRTKQYALGLLHGRRVLRLSPNEPNACRNLGLIYEKSGNDLQALKYYKHELSRDPYETAALWNIGRLYFRKRRWREAAKHLRRCFETGDEFEVEDTVDKLAICLHRLRDVRAYIEVFTSYVRIYPSSGWGYANLGWALMHTKDYKGAILRFSRASQLGWKEKVATDMKQARKLLQSESGGMGGATSGTVKDDTGTTEL
jgi:tetratricopeptide (TPR) repeat protein